VKILDVCCSRATIVGGEPIAKGEGFDSRAADLLRALIAAAARRANGRSDRL
jgi:hypothetical protein